MDHLVVVGGAVNEAWVGGGGGGEDVAFGAVPAGFDAGELNKSSLGRAVVTIPKAFDSEEYTIYSKYRFYSIVKKCPT